MLCTFCSTFKLNSRIYKYGSLRLGYSQNISQRILKMQSFFQKFTVREIHRSIGVNQIKPPEQASVNIFDRKAKLLQRERSAQSDDVGLYDYLKREIGYRVADRILDVKRKFSVAVDLGCSRGYVSKHILSKSVDKLILCDMCPTWLHQASSKEDISVERLVLDEEKLSFDPDSVDLFVSNLNLHWINDLPGTFTKVLKSLKKDGVFMASLFGGDTLYQLRSSLQLAELERHGGIAPHISPFTEIRDIGSLLTRAGFTMLTIDTDEIVISYPSMFELMWDIKGMAENNAAYNRRLNLRRDTMIAAAAIYDELYGMDRDGKHCVPATFQIIYFVGWKPDPSQPKPLPRGTGQVSLKDLYKLDEIISETQKIPIDDNDTSKK